MLVLDLEKLVHLLLVLDHGKSGLGILGNVSDLPRRQLRIGTHGDAMVSLGSQLGVVPFRRIVSDDQQLVPGLEAERQQAQGQELGVEIVILPRVGLPDPVVLVAHGPAGIAVLLKVVLEHLGPGIALFFVKPLCSRSSCPHALPLPGRSKTSIVRVPGSRFPGLGFTENQEESFSRLRRGRLEP